MRNKQSGRGQRWGINRVGGGRDESWTKWVGPEVRTKQSGRGQRWRELNWWHWLIRSIKRTQTQRSQSTDRWSGPKGSRKLIRTNKKRVLDSNTWRTFYRFCLLKLRTQLDWKQLINLEIVPFSCSSASPERTALTRRNHSVKLREGLGPFIMSEGGGGRAAPPAPPAGAALNAPLHCRNAFKNNVPERRFCLLTGRGGKNQDSGLILLLLKKTRFDGWTRTLRQHQRAGRLSSDSTGAFGPVQRFVWNDSKGSFASRRFSSDWSINKWSSREKNRLNPPTRQRRASASDWLTASTRTSEPQKPSEFRKTSELRIQTLTELNI